MVTVLQVAQNSSRPVAFILLQNGELVWTEIRVRKGRYFLCEYGFFQLNTDYRYLFGKTTAYFYYVKIPNPLDIGSLVKLWKTARKLEDPQIGSEDVTNPNLASEFDFTTKQFLDALKFQDEESLNYALDKPLRREKKENLSGRVMGLPAAPGKFCALYVRHDRRVLFVKLRPTQKDKPLLKCKLGEFDVSDRGRRCAFGKSSMYILYEGEKEPVNLNVYNMLASFVPFDPLFIQDSEEQIGTAYEFFGLATKPKPKKQLPIMLLLVGIIGFILVYQSVINPAISQWQTQEQIKAEKAAAAEAQARAQSLQQQTMQQPTGNTTATATPEPLPPGTPLIPSR